MKFAKATLLTAVLTTALAPLAHAQFGGVVYDPTQSAHAIEQIRQGVQQIREAEQIYTTARETMNEAIASYNLAYQMSRMPQDLAARYESNFSQWSSFSSASVPDAYGNTSAWIDALDFGSPARADAAYKSAVVPLQSYPAGSLSQQSNAIQADIRNQYASSELGQATVTNTLSTLGTIRADSEALNQKLANLDADTFSTAPSEQTTNALLGRINTATLLQIHSEQNTNQILAADAAQQALREKEQLDERNRLIDQSISFQQDFPGLMQNVTGGVSDSIRAISLGQ
jgi:hypothetical protein